MSLLPPTIYSHMLRYVLIEVRSECNYSTRKITSIPGDSLLLAVYSAGKRLRLYRATIDWQQSTGKDQIASCPKLSFQHLETIDDCCPMLDYTTQNQEPYILPSSEAQLSHLELFPQATDPRSKENASPTILATFSYLPNHYSVTEVREQPYTILSRWVMRNVESTLHTAFGSLTSKKSNSPMRLKVCSLRGLYDIVLKIICHIGVSRASTPTGCSRRTCCHRLATDQSQYCGSRCI